MGFEGERIMNKVFTPFFLFVISWSIGVITHAAFGSVVRETNALIEQCEKELPRSQKCILQAVPESKE